MGGLWSERFDWNEERIELVKKLWADGLSATLIAAEIGGISRNAVCGKIDRLGLPTRRTLVLRKPRADAGTGRRAHQRPPQARLDHIGDATNLVPELPTGIASDPVTLMELRDHHCRWPHEQPGQPMMYCGAHKLHGFSYCPDHVRMAHRRAA